MSGYTFYFLRGNWESIPDFEFSDCATDEEAMLAAARKLDDHSKATEVEVFNGVQVIGRIRRMDGPASRVGGRRAAPIITDVLTRRSNDDEGAGPRH